MIKRGRQDFCLYLMFFSLLSEMMVSLAGANADDPRHKSSKLTQGPCPSALETAWSLSKNAKLNFSQYKALWHLLRDGMFSSREYRMSHSSLIDRAHRLPLDATFEHRHRNVLRRSVLYHPDHKLAGLDLSHSVILITESGLRVEAVLRYLPDGRLQTSIILDDVMYDVSINWSQVKTILAARTKSPLVEGEPKLTTSYREKAREPALPFHSFYHIKFEQIIKVKGTIVWMASFSPDGNSILSTSSGIDGGVTFWNIQAGRKINILENDLINSYSSLWSHNGKMVLTSGSSVQKGSIVWNIQTGEEISSNHKWHPAAIFSMDDKSIITAKAIMDVVTGNDVVEFEQHQEGRSAHISRIQQSSDGKLVLMITAYSEKNSVRPQDYSVEIFDAISGRHLRTLVSDIDKHQTPQAYFVPQTHKILLRTATSTRNEDSNKFAIIDADSGSLIDHIEFNSLIGGDLSFSEDGDLVAAKSAADTSGVFSVKTGDLLIVLPKLPGLVPSIKSPQLSARGDRLMVNLHDFESHHNNILGIFRLFDLVTLDLAD